MSRLLQQLSFSSNEIVNLWHSSIIVNTLNRFFSFCLNDINYISPFRGEGSQLL